MLPFREKGVAAVLQIEDMASDFNVYYHGPGDTIGHMDQDYFIAQTKALVASIAHLAVLVGDGPAETPSVAASPVPSSTATPSAAPSSLVPTSAATPSAAPSSPIPIGTDTPAPTLTDVPAATSTDTPGPTGTDVPGPTATADVGLLFLPSVSVGLDR